MDKKKIVMSPIKWKRHDKIAPCFALTEPQAFMY